VPVGRIYTVRDIDEDPHYRARRMIETVTMADGTSLDVPGVVPKLSTTPGGLFRPAPTLGEHGSGTLAGWPAEDGRPPTSDARHRTNR